MKGLILKDILNFKNQQGKMFLILIVFYFLMALQMHSSSFFAGLWVILGATLPMSSVAYDEKAKWDKYALTMPITRKELVASKYLLSIIFIVTGSIISFPIIYIIDGKFGIENLIPCLVIIAIGITFNGIMLPFVFKFGVENSRIVMILIVGIPCLLIYILQQMNINFFMYWEKHVKIIGIAGIVAAVAIYVISWLLSIFIMEHKEIS